MNVPATSSPPPNAVFRRTETLFRALVEHAHDVILMLDQQGRVLYASPAVRNYGHDPEQIVGREVWDRLPPDRVAQVKARFEEAFRHPGGTFEFEETVIDATGQRRQKHAILQNLLQDPAVGAIVVNVHDITRRKQAEEALQQAHDLLEQRVAERTAELEASQAQLQQANEELERRVQERTADLQQLNLHLWEEIQQRQNAEERFRNVVEDQTEFIVRWLPDGTRTFVNSAYCRFFGQSRDELIGRSFFPLICDEDRERVRRLTQCVNPAHPVTDYEHRVIRPDGSLTWTQWNDRAIYDAAGRLVEYQSVGRDITAQKEAEDQLRQQQETLAHVGRLSVMGEMAAAIAHEIGQPLHAIATFAVASQKALEAQRPDSVPKALEWSGKIQEQVTRSTEIIRRLRQFTRAANQQQLADLNELIRESAALVAADLRRRRVRLCTDLSASLPPISVDPIQIEQVLVNLLCNAAEAMAQTPEGQRQIHIRSSAEHDRLVVTVRDQGQGLSQEAQQRLFQPFFTTKPDGMGIGLAISRRIVQEHGGELWAAANADGGMTFTFALPPAPPSPSPPTPEQVSP